MQARASSIVFMFGSMYVFRLGWSISTNQLDKKELNVLVAMARSRSKLVRSRSDHHDCKLWIYFFLLADYGRWGPIERAIVLSELSSRGQRRSMIADYVDDRITK
jgi:hypothetical protein